MSTTTAPVSTDTEETTVSTTVQIPRSVTAASIYGYGEITGAATNVDPALAKAAAQANRKVRALTIEQRATFAALADGGTVDVAALTDAIVAATAAAVTRRGQSMARRYQRDLLVGAWSWLKAGAPVPTDVSWTTGAPVTVTVAADGTVTVEVDLSEVTDKHARGEAEDAEGAPALVDIDNAFDIADAVLANRSPFASITL